jgi:hypothetical protein
MNLYLQYHNVDQEGLPLSDPPFLETRLGIHTGDSPPGKGLLALTRMSVRRFELPEQGRQAALLGGR